MAEALPGESTEAETLSLALNLMKEALEFLDESGAPADIGANLSLAIVRLEQYQAGFSVL